MTATFCYKNEHLIWEFFYKILIFKIINNIIESILGNKCEFFKKYNFDFYFVWLISKMDIFKNVQFQINYQI